MLVDFNVTKSDYLESLGLQEVSSSFIIGLLFQVYPPIQFNHQSWVEAGKISYIWADRMLAPKFEPGELPIS